MSACRHELGVGVSTPQSPRQFQPCRQDDVQLRFTIQRGLRPELIAHVIQSQPASIDELVRVARIAEAAAAATAAASTDMSLVRMINELAANRNASERNTEEIRRIAEFTGDMSITVDRREGCDTVI